MNEKKAIQELTETYRQSFASLLKKTLDAKIKGQQSDLELLASVNNTLKNLINQNQAFAGQVVPKIYGRTRKEVTKFLKDHGIDVTSNPAWRQTHKDAVVELQKALSGELNKSVIQIGRQYDDALRKITLEASKMQTAGGTTVDEKISEAVEKIANTGIDKVTYSNGARVNITKYVEMATRTNTSAAINRATANQQQEYGHDLVKLSFHSTSCPICAPYQGRVYSLTGNDKYPHISQINNGNFENYGTIHPNCQHRALPYIEELDDDVEETRRDSNKEFEDNRTEFSKERYKQRQKTNRRLRQIEDLEKKNAILSAKGTKVAKKKIRENKEKIQAYIKEVEEIKKWEIDGLSKNQLFK